MMPSEFDPTKIRKCELINIEGHYKIQFIATGDKHQMMKEDDGSINIIKLPEQGKDYRYGDPCTPEEALTILDQGHRDGHDDLAQQIRTRLSSPLVE